MKKLSIIIPVYNSEKTIKKCIESVLKQKNNDIEIVIINDGSTDNSENIIKEYIEKYHEIISYYKKENTGVADTRNYGIKKAKGKYIMFLDSDDFIADDFYNTINKYMDQDIDLIKFKLQRLDENGNITEKVDGPVFENITGEEGFKLLYSTDVLLDSPCVYIIKKEIFTNNELYFKTGTEHEDFGLIPFVIILAKTMISINFYGYQYVQSNESITRNSDYNKTIKKANDALKQYDEALLKIKKYKIDNDTSSFLKIYYTNAILLKTETLNSKDQKEYINQIKNRKMLQNIKARNLKQAFKKCILFISVKGYLKLRKKF